MNGQREPNGGTTTTGTGVSDAASATAMIRVENLHRSHGTGAGAVHALRGVTCGVPRGELVALRGRSGSGKTTLLNLIGGLDTPDSGRITVDGTPLADLTENELLATRRDRIGFGGERGAGREAPRRPGATAPHLDPPPRSPVPSPCIQSPHQASPSRQSHVSSPPRSKVADVAST
ncbi:ABC transporter ATP-binding protein [Streptomyces noursei]|uniref:ABC transporter ATP-binding protein n=1 Tax=Streptomyces noursei TaxID=1971 RepID=A0A401R8V3_STRNR|nr:ABC transporter ATP-binding protein [Streptomyces noursei]